jgi:ubiquinone/menaquinone biosynthesis C-methylase UbiE
MDQNMSQKIGGQKNKYLMPMLKELTYFRALLRAVEADFYKHFELTEPVLDIGCGDGQFAEMVFDRALSVGMDPEHSSLVEAKGRKSYRSLVQSLGDKQPFPNQHFKSAISNSVLEHIPQVQDVLAECGRLMQEGSLFLFCVPNHRWAENLRISGILRRLKLETLARFYENLFIRISRHVNMLSPKQWEKILNDSGFSLKTHWHYFSPKALHTLEIGHYLGLPSWIMRILFGRWIVAPWKWNLALLVRSLAPLANAGSDENGTYTWIVARKN